MMAAAWATIGSRVQAEPAQALDLQWSAPETCPVAADVRREIERHLGHPLGSPADTVAARAVITSDKGDRWRMSLRTHVHGDAHERVIEGDSCSAVADAAALILAFLIDPKSAGSHATHAHLDGSSFAAVPRAATADANTETASMPAPASSVEAMAPAQLVAPAQLIAPAVPTAKAPEPDTPSTAQPSSRPAPLRRWTLRAIAGADSSSLPSWTGFVGVGVGRAFGRGSIELSGAYYAPRARELGTADPRGGTFELLTLGARGCYAFFGPTFEIGPCLGAEYGTVRGAAFGVGDPGVGKGLWVAASAAGTARWRLAPWLGTVAEAGIALPIVRPDYVINNVGVVYRADFVGLRLLAGLESYF